MRFRVLGPVEVADDAGPVPLGSDRALTVLAGLLMSANREVPVPAMFGWLWDDGLPHHPRAVVHNAVCRLRRLVGPGRIETLRRGYLLRVGGEELDLLRFLQLSAAARQAAADGSDERALAAMDEAVGLWRKPLLGNISSSTLLAEALPWLTEQYLDAAELRAELCLRLGRQQGLAGELSSLARAHPFRERLVGQLMIALVRGGRQAEALAAYHRLRHDLAQELGIDPTAELQDLHLKILRSDPVVQL